MSAAYGPQTTVLDGCVLEREPKSSYIDRISVEKRAGLMTRHFAADVWLFEEVHRLEQVLVGVPERGGQPSDFWPAGETIEDRIEIVQRVSDLVNAFFFPVFDRAARIE